MVHLLGAVLVAAGGALLGFQAAAGLRKRGRAVRQMEEGLALLERELELSAPPLSRLLERGAAHSQGPARGLFQGCARGLDRLDREDFSSLWRRMVRERTELTPEGQAVLLPLGDTLGRYDGERQREALAAARRRLGELAGRLEADSRRQGRVYQVLGLSGGAFLVIGPAWWGAPPVWKRAAEGGGPYSLSQPSADSSLKEGAFPLGGTKDYERGRTYIWKSI